MSPVDLLTRWRGRAEELEPYAAPAAEAFRRPAEELEAALAELAAEPITPAQAEAEGLCDAETVRRAVREGRAENLGSRGKILVRRGEVPSGRGGRRARGPSLGETARQALSTRLPRR